MSPFQVPNGPFSIEQVMDAIRQQIVEPGEARNSDETAPRVVDGTERAELAACLEELGRLAPLDVPYRIHSHRPVIGRAFDIFKRLIHWGSRPYTDMVRERQAAVNAALTQAIAALAREAARLDEARGGIQAAMERLAATQDETRKWVESEKARLEASQARFEEVQGRLARRHDLAPFFASIPKETRLAALRNTRGAAELIGQRQAHYAALFEGAPGPVVDIGCGRGELLGLLRARGIECRGVEIDPLMAEVARSQGVEVDELDALEALRRAAPGGLGGVFAAQVVEHLFPGELGELLMLARQKLARGGCIVLETVNVSSPGAVFKSFYRDMDHKLPLHPEYLKLLLEISGFERVELHYSAPFEPAERLPDIPPAEEIELKPAARRALQGLVDQINDRFYGMQDYYVVGYQGEGGGSKQP